MGWGGDMVGLGWSLSGWLGRWLGWVGGVAFKQSKSCNDFFTQNILGDFNHDFPHDKLPKK